MIYFGCWRRSGRKLLERGHEEAPVNVVRLQQLRRGVVCDGAAGGPADPEYKRCIPLIGCMIVFLPARAGFCCHTGITVLSGVGTV